MNLSKTGIINTTGIIQNQTLAGFSTNNIYWNAEPLLASQTRGYGTVGQDVDTLNGVLDEWQYADVNHTERGIQPKPIIEPNNYNIAGLPTCHTSSMGTERISVYTQFIDQKTHHALTITGGELLAFTNQITLIIFANGQESGGQPSDQQSCPIVQNTESQLFYDWGVRAPPSINQGIHSNWGIFDTIGAQLVPTGTNALGLDQFIDRTYQVGNSQVLPAVSQITPLVIGIVILAIAVLGILTILAIRKK